MAGGVIGGRRTPAYHDGLRLLGGYREHIIHQGHTYTCAGALSSWESQAHLRKELKSCHFLRKLTRENQVGRICVTGI